MAHLNNRYSTSVQLLGTASADTGEEPQPELFAEEEEPQVGESEDGGVSSLCPVSMALGAMTMVLAGVVISRRRS